MKTLKLWLVPGHPARGELLALVLLRFDYRSIFFSAFDTVLLNYVHNILAKTALLMNSFTLLSQKNVLSRLAVPGWGFSDTAGKRLWHTREPSRFTPLKYKLPFSPSRSSPKEWRHETEV